MMTEQAKSAMLFSCKNQFLRDGIFDTWNSAANERHACSLPVS